MKTTALVALSLLILSACNTAPETAPPIPAPAPVESATPPLDFPGEVIQPDIDLVDLYGEELATNFMLQAPELMSQLSYGFFSDIVGSSDEDIISNSLGTALNSSALEKFTGQLLSQAQTLTLSLIPDAHGNWQIAE